MIRRGDLRKLRGFDTETMEGRLEGHSVAKAGLAPFAGGTYVNMSGTLRRVDRPRTENLGGSFHDMWTG